MYPLDYSQDGPIYTQSGIGLMRLYCTVYRRYRAPLEVFIEETWRLEISSAYGVKLFARYVTKQQGRWRGKREEVWVQMSGSDCRG